MAHVLVGTPMLVTNRRLIQTWYNVTNDDGSKIILGSSQHNEAFYEKHKDLDTSGGAVITNLVVQYTKFVPYDGGFDIVSVNQTDPNGMLPGFVKTKMA